MTAARLFPLALLTLPFGLRAQQPAAEPPAAAPVTAAALPRAQEALLPNGLRLVLLAQHRQPVVSVALTVAAGSAFDAEGREGTADLLAALLTRGGGARGAAEVARAVEEVGGSLSAIADPDQLTLQADVISPQAALAFELMADALLRPTLDSAEFAGQRDRTAASLSQGLGDPGTLGARVFLIGTYRESPYARRPTPQSVAAITRQDLLAFHRARVRPAGALLVVAGDITLVEARRLALRWFGGWKGLRPAALPAPRLSPVPKGILLVHAGGAREANIVLGSTTFAGTDTAYYAAAVLNRILGDPRAGRLARVLVSQAGWTQAAGSSFLRTARLGLVQATTTVPAEVADSAVRVMYAEATRLRADLVPARELERAREAVAGAFALQLQTASQLAATVSEARALGLPTTYLAGYRPRVLAVTAAQVRAVARRMLPEAGVVTVVVGDASKLYDRLSAIAPVRIFAADGRPLSPEQVQPTAAAWQLDTAPVAPRIDSLVIVAQGQTVGLQVARIARAGDSLVYVEQTALGTVLSQTTTLVFEPAGRMRSLDQHGTVRGQDTRIQLRYATDRVRGTADLATAAGPRHVDVDTPVPPGVVDDNAVQAVLPLLPWALNRRWSFPVFASGENLIRTLTLTAADITQVSVPAGTFECYRADLEGGPQRVSFFVTTAAPHRVVRVELANSPIVFLAVNK